MNGGRGSGGEYFCYRQISRFLVGGNCLPIPATLCYNRLMNGYDFDKTIIKGNSVSHFSLFCCVRLPYLWLLLPVFLLACLLYGVRIIGKDKFLHMLEFFIVFVPRREKFVKKYWDKRIKCIKPWYWQIKRDDDIIISASPDYLINEICGRLGVACITSSTGKHGTVKGKHCYGARKVELYRERFGDTPLETFYSDSMSDAPMFKLAKRGYYVKGNKITLIYQEGKRVA